VSNEQPQRKDEVLLNYERPVEIAHLSEQVWLLIRTMGDLMADLPKPDTMQRVLDIGCGPGDWAMDVAFTYPHLEVAGIDRSPNIIQYANAKAWSQHLTNVSFGVMDVFSPLDFSDNTFDLVQGTLLSGLVPAVSWQPLLRECLRILRPGGVLRLIDCDKVRTNCASCERFSRLLCQLLHASGYGFSPDGDEIGVTPVLESFLRQTGFAQVKNTAYVINWSADTPAWHSACRSLEITGQMFLDALDEKKVMTRKDAEMLYKQALIDMRADSFCGIWPFLSVRGVKP
jgi:ubiquinone/menaquinone biosynthesis C-methylase UbiE